MGDRHRQDGDVAPHDDGPGPLVDDHAGHDVRVDLQELDRGDEIHDLPVRLKRGRDGDSDRRSVERASRACTDLRIDRLGDAAGGCVVPLEEHHGNGGIGANAGGHRFVKQGSTRDAPRGGVVSSDFASVCPDAHASHRERPLGHGIDRAFRSGERGQQERSSLEACGVPHGGDDHIGACAFLCIAGDGGGHHDGGNVSKPEIGLRNGDAEPLQHA